MTSTRTSGSGADKDTNQPSNIVSLHLANDSDNNLNDNDDDESVKSFRSDCLNDRKLVIMIYLLQIHLPLIVS